MYSKRIAILSIFVLSTYVLQSQTYISPQQKMTYEGFADRIELFGEKKVVIDGNDFSIEIPDGGVLAGRMTLIQEIERDTEKRTIYELSGGGLLSVIDDEDDNYDHIYVNLMGTSHKKTITYWLVAGNKGDD